jgi:hypothetical protein
MGGGMLGPGTHYFAKLPLPVGVAWANYATIGLAIALVV